MLTVPVNAQSGRKHGEEAVFYPVARIVDGDTFDDGSKKGLKVRLKTYSDFI